MAQTLRQAARSRVKRQLEQRRAQRLEQEQRIADHTLEISTAWIERQRTLEETEDRIAKALQQLTEVEGIPLNEIAMLCEIPAKEVQRIRRDQQQQDRRPTVIESSCATYSTSTPTRPPST